MCFSHQQRATICVFRYGLYLLFCISKEEKEESKGKRSREKELCGIRKEDMYKILYCIRSEQSMSVELDEAL